MSKRIAKPNFIVVFAGLVCLSGSACRRSPAASASCAADDSACTDAAGDDEEGTAAGGHGGTGAKTQGAARSATAGVAGGLSTARKNPAGAGSLGGFGGSRAVSPPAESDAAAAGGAGGSVGPNSAPASAKDGQDKGKQPGSAGTGGASPSAAGSSAMDGKSAKPKADNPGNMKDMMGNAGGADAPACTDDACKAARLAACDAKCGSCEACSPDKLSCEPVRGQDDADSCAGARSCSRKAACLTISAAQPDLGDSVDWVDITAKYAQVIELTEPAHVEEIRLEVSCVESTQTFPPVWISRMENGQPSATPLSFAIVSYQEPAQGHNYAVLELSKTFDEPETGPFAIVVGESDNDCNVRINKAHPYEHGSLLKQLASGLWAPAEVAGSMVFEVLSSR